MVDQSKPQQVRVLLRAATNDAGWRALWEFLLSPPDDELCTPADELGNLKLELGSVHDQESDDV